MLNKTCILYFARTAAEELKYKRLDAKKSVSLKLIQNLQSNTIATIKRSGLPFVLHLSDKQKENNFTDNLTQAIDHTFQSYDNIIVVGYDCPMLSINDLNTAAANFEQDKNTIGGDKNGGAYLIGIQKKSWRKEEFENLDWQTDQLYKQLTTLYFEENEIDILSSKIDLNSSFDVLRTISYQFLSGFLKRLLQLIIPLNSSFDIQCIPLRKTQVSHIRFRGPPSL